MSTGAVFKLICNDGKADRIINASELLRQRIADVMCARRRSGKADVTPTLVDLERTHILYVNAHFKPFAAIGYEYNKVRTSSGTPVLGSGVQFSIPQFGDFFHDMVCRTRLSQVRANAGPLPSLGSAHFPLNVAAGQNTPARFYNIVDAFGNRVVAGGTQNAQSAGTYRNFVRYCEFPGNRLFHQTKFDVNGNPLDQYDEMIPVFLEKFCTAPNKRVGHDRLIGQEVPLTGYGPLCAARVSDADSTNTPAGITHSVTQSNQQVSLFATGATPANVQSVLSQTTPSALNASNTQRDISRQLLQVVNGPQTPKPVQAPLEIWNKLRFWFCDDVRLSIASVSIPHGQRYITVELGHQQDLVFEVPSIYLETIVDGDALADVGGQINITAAATRVKTYTPIFIKNGIEDVTISSMELYINNIFVNPEIHDIYIKRIGFSLIRVYRQQAISCNSGDGEKLLSNLKWPVEYMFVGMRPDWNNKEANLNKWRDWHRMTRMVDATDDRMMEHEAPSGTAAAGFGGSIGQVTPNQYYLPVPTVDHLSLTTHGIVIFDKLADTFFNQYMPMHFGGAAITTPDDPGALFVNISLYPRAYQPSGHLNISRARETYMSYHSSYVSEKSVSTMIVVAVAINFLLITDGSAVLRYST